MTRLSAPKMAHILYARKPYPLLSQIKNYKISPQSAINSDNCAIEDEDVCNIKSRCSTKVYNGEPLIDNEVPQVISLSTSRHFLDEEIDIPSSPKLPSPKDPLFNQIFCEKIKICNYIFNFSRPQFQLQGKKEKTIALAEINILLSNKTKSILLSSKHKDLLLDMIMKNLSVQDPFSSVEKIFQSTVKSSYVESSWEHISLIFKILNKFVLLFPDKCEFELVKKGVLLMNIPDSNESENLVTFMKNYIKVHPEQNEEIWKLLKCAILNVRYDIYTPYCLEPIFSYLINIFFSNKKSISQILYTHLLPLFRLERLSLYFSKLVALIDFIIEGNITEQYNVIQYLVKHFPYQCGHKQPLFVSALAIFTKSMTSSKLNIIARQLFIFIAMAIKSPNSRLAENALTLLMKKNMRPVILSNYDYAFRILYEPVKWCAGFYWDQAVRGQSQDVLSLLMNAKFDNQNTISSYQESNFNFFETKKRNDYELAQVWATLSRITARRDRSFNLTQSLQIIKKEFQNENKDIVSTRRKSQPCYLSNHNNIQFQNSPLLGTAKLLQNLS